MEQSLRISCVWSSGGSSPGTASSASCVGTESAGLDWPCLLDRKCWLSPQSELLRKSPSHLRVREGRLRWLLPAPSLPLLSLWCFRLLSVAPWKQTG